MEFKQLLQKLKFSNIFNRSSVTKAILENIRHVNKTELLYILELIQDKTDMELQVKLISILTAHLFFNNSNRDVIIKCTSLYDTLSTILARGLPLKTTITLNFVTSLLYTKNNGGTRNRTLTLYAQNSIRNSGCLTAMISLFTNYMLQHDTWIALCRCLAEVCHGSELNQNLCSHLVPICIQRGLQGTPEVIPLLQSLMLHHKRNTKLFMETDGGLIFNRKDYLRLEAVLQLLNTVIQNADVEAIRTMLNNNRIYEDLVDLVNMNSASLNIVQWTTIVLYYLDSKLKETDKPNCRSKKLGQNVLNMSASVNDTQILLQNIMTEVLSHPSKIYGHNSVSQLSKISDNLSSKSGISHFLEKIKLHHNESNNLENKLYHSPKPKSPRNERLSFSFLMNESLKCDQSDFDDRTKDNNKFRMPQTLLDSKKYIRREEVRDSSQLCDTFKTFDSKCESVTEFKPTFISTPKKVKAKMHYLNQNTPIKKSFTELKNKRNIKHRTIVKKLSKTTISQEKDSVKHRSMSSRLFEAINESCTTVIRSVKNVFTGNKTTNTPKRVTANVSNIKNSNEQSNCSYSFTNYMRAREAELQECNTNKDVSIGTNTEINTVNICNTCDDTFLLHNKLASDEHLKYTVKKLKLGINLYGCDFKRISKTMWPRETYMTPIVLYNLYRKLILK